MVESGWKEEKRLGYHDAIAIYLPIPTCVATIIAINIYLFYPKLHYLSYSQLRYAILPTEYFYNAG